MTNHTPGPWVITPASPDAVFAMRQGAPYSFRVAECLGYRTEREANARLIAAAPDMIDAPQHAAHVLAELQNAPQLLALRVQIIETIKQATLEYYGGGVNHDRTH